ncbi:glucosidase II beta subunit-like-domain-containing protein [Boletus coccyginus]|nr:glucosidase II beta subunit-like-domain-containing protein [Boletus coccyginus]
MIPWLLLALPLPALAALDKTHGVPPALQAKYTPSASGTWSCLDGSKEILWSAVNDDYCDCPDGSDEPGTGACPGTTFYCKNVGHIGTTIPSSRVQDRLCEPECCDGSDEALGVCSNTCEEVGQEYRKKEEAARKLRKTGSKIRATYIAFAQKEQKLTSRELDVERSPDADSLQDVAKHAESMSAAELERKKQSPLYQSLLTHHMALKSLQREHKVHVEKEKAFGDILDALRTGYNPNYQDMAVLEAVRGWELLAGLPHINDIRKGEDSGEEKQAHTPEVEEEDEGIWNADQIEKELDRLLKTDHISLLLEHDKIVGHPGTQSILFEATAYLPDSLVPRYVSLRDTVLSWLKVFGIGSGKFDASDEANQARQALSDAEHSLKLTREEEQTARDDLSNLFDLDGFGPEGEWKKLDGVCLEKDTGDYTYEVCLFDEARQKPNKGGSTFSLGKFSSWNKLAKPGELEYYTKQHYTQGTKCWNGPQRSVELILSCGTENILLTVAELEKCEYQITGTSPALCRPLEDENNKDEL